MAAILFSMAAAVLIAPSRVTMNSRLSPPICLANAVTNGLVGTKFCVNVKLCIKPERRAEFVECIRNNQEGTLRTEPLAIEYVWGEDVAEPNTFQ